MGRFLIIEEHTYLPRWLAERLGACLPPVMHDAEALCGAQGRRLVFHDLSSMRAKRKLTERLCDEQGSGTVCGILSSGGVRQALTGSLTAPLFDGSLLCTSLRLARIVRETDCAVSGITLDGADSELGQAAAVYLAKRVRFLSLVGRKTSLLDRLSKRLWQTGGIAVRVGRGEDDRILSMDEISSPSKWVSAEGRPLPPVIAECALIAGSAAVCDGRIITARTLEKMAEAAQFHGIELLAKKDTEIAEFD